MIQLMTLKKPLPSAASRFHVTVADKGHFRISTSEFRLPTFDHDLRLVLYIFIMLGKRELYQAIDIYWKFN